MFIYTHVLFGIIFGLLSNNVVLVAFASVIIHYLMDILPVSVDGGNLLFEGKKELLKFPDKKKSFMVHLFFMQTTILCLLLVILHIKGQLLQPSILAGIIASLLPDVVDFVFTAIGINIFRHHWIRLKLNPVLHASLHHIMSLILVAVFLLLS